MPNVDDLPELPELVEAALIVVVRMLLALGMVLQTLFWICGVCAVVYLFKYWRGY
jgi:hypothetical protein